MRVAHSKETRVFSIEDPFDFKVSQTTYKTTMIPSINFFSSSLSHS
jgi:hypothetical protein